MIEPTQEQIKEFWEWCGMDRYYCGEEIDIKHFPPIDLNNLFEYAVPKLNSCELVKHDRPDLDGWFATVRIKMKTGFINHKDPALTLFWAIWEVIK